MQKPKPLQPLHFLWPWIKVNIIHSESAELKHIHSRITVLIAGNLGCLRLVCGFHYTSI